jgi:hypothetical protein
VLAIVSVTLAGCGGGKMGTQPTTTATTPHKPVALGKAAYERTMKRLGNQLVRSVEGLFPLVEAQPGTDVSKETVARLTKTRAVVTNVTARVAEIAPPSAIRAEHQQLLRGVSALGRELDSLIDVEEHGPPAGGPKAFGVYARFNSLRTIAKATKAMAKKGYQVG